MKYMITFPLPKDTFKETMARFLDNGGLPPAGVTMLGRWHSLSTSESFVLAETDDPTGVYRWLASWSDLLDFRVIPVIEDTDAEPILRELKP